MWSAFPIPSALMPEGPTQETCIKHGPCPQCGAEWDIYLTGYTGADPYFYGLIEDEI